MNIKDLVFTRENLHFNKGDTIFKERDEGEEMYFIDSGEIQVVKALGDVDVNIASLSPGDFFGEMALITGSKRSTSAIAVTDCSLHVMDKETFKSNITNNRDFDNRLLVSLAHRLEKKDLSFTILFEALSKSTKP
ncbi:MAG: cyclic nucleotide-binding domain-containing protein [Planctomycetota bacterium]|jgi:CRP-like cAMP-binding protein